MEPSGVAHFLINGTNQRSSHWCSRRICLHSRLRHGEEEEARHEMRAGGRPQVLSAGVVKT